ncbi:MAG: arginine--tRNA ligase [Candidatus Omnitrophica bacterium]|nr:arginine--tRNA ligase [Candidatus Omnitrophota bacterium]
MDILYTEIKSCLENSLKSCFPSLVNIPLEIELLLCRELSHGDLYSNIIFKLIPHLKKSFPEIEGVFLPKLRKEIEENVNLRKWIKKIDFKSPGFINFFLSEEYLCKSVGDCLREKEKFGSSNLGEGKTVLIEFVSANPTGPLNIAHGRQAAIGEALANILNFLGYKVEKEYYINDEGVQMENLAKSIWVRYRQILGEDKEFPDNGYKGEYIIDIARKIPLQKERFSEWDKKTYKFFSQFGCQEILKMIKEDLERLGVKFDHWREQSSLINSGKVREAIDFLKRRGFIYEKEGALWFKSTVFGDDKDRVVVKSEGEFTYIASDIAYHKDKYERGFDILINLWGPDHHGYIPRLYSAIKALGYDEKRLKILIVQLATLYRDGKLVPLSTRAGNFIALEEVVKEIGKDVTRFFFLNRRRDSHLDFDIALAKRESAENPVYYLQYAYARINSLKKYAMEKGINLEEFIEKQTHSTFLISHLGEGEFKIIRILQQFPYILIESARNLEPNIIIVYLQALSKAFHQYYSRFRIIDSDLEKSYARIMVALAGGIVLGNGLKLLGISLPERM